MNIKEHCENGQRHLYVKDLASAHVRRWGWRWVDEFCWAHEGIPGKWANRLKNQLEPIFHFAASDKVSINHSRIEHRSDRAGGYEGKDGTTSTGNVGFEGRVFSGLALPGNVLRINHGVGRDDSAKHPAKFPVELVSFFLRAFTTEGACIADPFAGSGTSVVAAEHEGHACMAIEISPIYCDVIVERWENLTGGKAKRSRG